MNQKSRAVLIARWPRRRYDPSSFFHNYSPAMSQYRCEGCGAYFNEWLFSHARAEDDGRGNPVPVECGPIHCQHDEGERIQMWSEDGEGYNIWRCVDCGWETVDDMP